MWDFMFSISFGKLKCSLSTSTAPKSYLGVKLRIECNFCSRACKSCKKLKKSVLKVKSWKLKCQVDSGMWKFLGEGNKKFIQSFAFSHLTCVCIMKGFCYLEIGLHFHITSPGCFEVFCNQHEPELAEQCWQREVFQATESGYVWSWGTDGWSKEGHFWLSPFTGLFLTVSNKTVSTVGDRHARCMNASST